MVKLRQWLDSRGRWARLLIVLLLGGMSGTVFQPLSLVPVLPVALVGLLLLLHGTASRKGALFIGWAFGASHFLVGLYWIGNAFMVHAERHAVLAVPAVVAMAAVLGFFVAVVAWLYRVLVPGQKVSVTGIAVFAALWVASEWVRSWAFTGFPWNLVGNLWTVSDAMLQSAAVGGVFSLSLITVFVFSLPAVVGSNEGGNARIQWYAPLSALAFLCIMYGGGQYRLTHADSSFVEDVRLRLVQPNIAQNQKWDPDLRSTHVARQLEASLVHGDEQKRPTHIIWAETAVPYVLSNDAGLVALLGRAVPENGALITGSLRAGFPDQDGGRPPIWNSLFAIGPQGNILATYDKYHLVPFGEYVPFQDILPITKLTSGTGGFATGAGRQNMVLPGMPVFSPLICYEIIFPGSVVADDQSRPSWILNLTNDAWYGISAGPFQHFAMARIRAVEEGLPVVRVANTGISGVIDGYGRVVKSLPLGTAGTIDSDLPSALPATPYGRWGNALPMILVAAVLMFGITRRQRADT